MIVKISNSNRNGERVMDNIFGSAGYVVSGYVPRNCIFMVGEGSTYIS